MSELLFCGTGAADWEISQRSGFFRRNSAALLNGELMLDCGKDIFDFAESIGNESLYDTVTDIVITHNHYDHVNPQSVLKLAKQRKIRVGCDEAVAKLIGKHQNIEYILFEPFKTFSLGKYEIIPLLANHDIVAHNNCYSFHYIVKTPDDKKLFYGLDGAWFLRPSWNEMIKHKFDLMVFDCTVGDFHDWRIFEHNTIPMLRDMTKEITEQQLLTTNGNFVASHLARTLHSSHEETAEILKEFNMITAYDGLNILF